MVGSIKSKISLTCVTFGWFADRVDHVNHQTFECQFRCATQSVPPMSNNVQGVIHLRITYVPSDHQILWLVGLLSHYK